MLKNLCSEEGDVLFLAGTNAEVKAPECICDALGLIRGAGIKAAFVSNNNAERVEMFNKNLEFPAYFKAGKPFKKNILRALSDMGVTPSEAILMGDQIFTDVWAARNAGIRAILLPPINDRRDLVTRAKRVLERPIIKKYRKRNNI